MASCANISGMKVDLNTEELEEIASWYSSCCRESRTSRTDVIFALLDKLGIEAESLDLHISTVCGAEERAAVVKYLIRHPGKTSGDLLTQAASKYHQSGEHSTGDAIQRVANHMLKEAAGIDAARRG